MWVSRKLWFSELSTTDKIFHYQLAWGKDISMPTCQVNNTILTSSMRKIHIYAYMSNMHVKLIALKRSHYVHSHSAHSRWLAQMPLTITHTITLGTIRVPCINAPHQSTYISLCLPLLRIPDSWRADPCPSANQYNRCSVQSDPNIKPLRRATRSKYNSQRGSMAYTSHQSAQVSICQHLIET